MKQGTLRRIGAIGDIHGEDTRLAGVLEFLARADVDGVLAVGDIVDGQGDVSRCCRLLRDAGVATVRGNHERWFAANTMRELHGATMPGELDPEATAFLAALPVTLTVQTVAGPLLLCHGLGSHDMASVRPDDAGYALEVNDELHALVRSGQFAFVVNGHTHQRMVRCFGTMTVINAGTLYAAHAPCFAVIDFERAIVEFHDVAPNGCVTPAQRYAWRVDANGGATVSEIRDRALDDK